MPGLAGVVFDQPGEPMMGLRAMLEVLTYGRAATVEYFEDDFAGLGCVHLGTGGQQYLYQGEAVTVAFFGYLTDPAVPPGAAPGDPCAAAHLIYDLYLRHGEGFVRMLEGAFAFALWDQREHVLLLGSDHLGLRPIYYARHQGSFRFASEVKGILSDVTFPHRANMAAWADLFQFGYLLEDKTYFEDIHLLPPASVLRLKDGRFSISSYWEVSFPDHYPHHPEKYYWDAIFQAIESSVKKMVRSNLQYGLSLSGGLDLRWIAAFLPQYQPNALAFTLGNDASDDTLLSKRVTALTGLKQQIWEPENPYTRELSELYIYLVDGMDSLSSTDELTATLHIGDYVDVAAGGFLAGPIFGYDINPWSMLIRKPDVERYYQWRYQSEHLPDDAAELVFGQQKSLEMKALANESLKRCLASAPCQRGFQVLQYFNLRHHQRRCVNSAQLAKLAFVDIYHPLADDEVVNVALQLPVSQLMVEHAYGRALAEHFPELGAIPWTFTLEPLTISRTRAVLKKTAQLTLGKLLRGTKFGQHPLIRPRVYFTNHAGWMRGEGRSFIEETLNSSELNAMDLFQPTGLKTVVSEYMEGKREATSFVSQALNFALWTRQFYLPERPEVPQSAFLQPAVA